MKKSKIQIAILIICFLLLVGVYAFLTLGEGKEQAEEEKAKYVVNAMSYDEITEFSYTYQGTEIHMEKEDGTWKVSGDEERNLIQEDVENMLMSALSIYGNEEIAEVTDFSQYGFEEPMKTITLKTKSGQVVLQIGAVNEITGDYYIRRMDDTKVYTVGSSLYYCFEQSLEDLTQEETTEEETVAEEVTEEN